jgi:predicted aconitase
LSDWGAFGGIVGQATNSYWEVPVISGVASPPNSDELKHFGAALASFGSTAMFHMPGVTPEAATLNEAFGDKSPPVATQIGPENSPVF